MGQDRAVKVWDFTEEKHTLVKGFRSAVLAIDYVLGGNILAVAVGASVVFLDAWDGRVVRTLEGHTDRIIGLSRIPNRSMLLSASADGTVRFWQPESGAQGAVLDWKMGPLSSLAVAPDGMTAVVGGKEGKVIMWDLDGL